MAVAPAGSFLDAVGAFPVHREGADRLAVDRAQDVLERGDALILFPEGTRRSGPVVEELHEGAAFLAARTGAPVVPIGIGGTAAAMPKGSRFVRPVKVHLVVGDPLPAPERSARGRVPRRPGARPHRGAPASHCKRSTTGPRPGPPGPTRARGSALRAEPGAVALSPPGAQDDPGVLQPEEHVGALLRLARRALVPHHGGLAEAPARDVALMMNSDVWYWSCSRVMSLRTSTRRRGTRWSCRTGADR